MQIETKKEIVKKIKQQKTSIVLICFRKQFLRTIFFFVYLTNVGIILKKNGEKKLFYFSSKLLLHANPVFCVTDYTQINPKLSNQNNNLGVCYYRNKRIRQFSDDLCLCFVLFIHSIASGVAEIIQFGSLLKAEERLH